MTNDKDIRFAANLGFLWSGLPTAERIANAAAAGFAALEFHDSLQTDDWGPIEAALAKAELPVTGLNTRMGETLGCAALPGMQDQAREDIDAAIDAAAKVGARAIHVTAGKASGTDARSCYIDSLRYALGQTDLIILIEPISAASVPGYFLNDIDQAAGVLDEIGEDQLKIMFDCYHVQETRGAVLADFQRLAGRIGCVQIASHPQRAEPWPGALDYNELLPAFVEAGYTGYFSAEYIPATTMEKGLDWLEQFNTHGRCVKKN